MEKILVKVKDLSSINDLYRDETTYITKIRPDGGVLLDVDGGRNTWYPEELNFNFKILELLPLLENGMTFKNTTACYRLKRIIKCDDDITFDTCDDEHPRSKIIFDDTFEFKQLIKEKVYTVDTGFGDLEDFVADEVFTKGSFVLCNGKYGRVVDVSVEELTALEYVTTDKIMGV